MAASFFSGFLLFGGDHPGVLLVEEAEGGPALEVGEQGAQLEQEEVLLLQLGQLAGHAPLAERDADQVVAGVLGQGEPAHAREAQVEGAAAAGAHGERVELRRAQTQAQRRALLLPEPRVEDLEDEAPHHEPVGVRDQRLGEQHAEPAPSLALGRGERAPVGDALLLGLGQEAALLEALLADVRAQFEAVHDLLGLEARVPGVVAEVPLEPARHLLELLRGGRVEVELEVVQLRLAEALAVCAARLQRHVVGLRRLAHGAGLEQLLRVLGQEDLVARLARHDLQVVRQRVLQLLVRQRPQLLRATAAHFTIINLLTN